MHGSEGPGVLLLTVTLMTKIQGLSLSYMGFVLWSSLIELPASNLTTSLGSSSCLEAPRRKFNLVHRDSLPSPPLRLTPPLLARSSLIMHSEPQPHHH